MRLDPNGLPLEELAGKKERTGSRSSRVGAFPEVMLRHFELEKQAAAQACWVDAQGYAQAVEHLRRCSTTRGFWASTVDRANYRRVWGRDSMIIGLAALLTGQADLMQAFRESILTLAQHQGPQGEIPSNVDLHTGRISYGGTTGRVDANLWFVVGATEYWRATGDDELMASLWPCLQRVMRLLAAWEFNNRGLIYVPQTGDWADEYIHSGYVLYDQLLHLQAQISVVTLGRSLNRETATAAYDRIDRLRRLIRMNYWFMDGEEETEDAYHEVLYRKGKEAAPECQGRYWMPFFMPSGYGYRFDAFANVLASLLGVADRTQSEAVDAYVGEIVPQMLPLLPAFHPVIKPVNQDWKRLHMTFSYTFRNRPHEFQNGGLWPMITGFYVADLAARGRMEEARRHLLAIHQANAMRLDETQPSFPEFVHGKRLKAGGTALLGWSAAAAILGEHALRGESVFRIKADDVER